MRKLIARFRTSFGFLYPLNLEYDALLKYCIASGVFAVVENSMYDLHIIFNNEIEFKGWNANKWYSWLSHDSIFSGKITASFHHERPSAQTMIDLNNLLKNHIPNERVNLLEKKLRQMNVRIDKIEANQEVLNKKTKRK